MPFCPRCKTEYRPGFTVCSDCQVELVEELADKSVNEEKGRQKAVEIRWVFLKSVYNDLEADILSGLFESAGIPTHRKYPGLGAYAKVYFGTTIGVDVYVPEQKLQQALEIIEGMDTTKS